MNAMPLVSAVIPTRNRPELVHRAVQSVLQQTHPNMEVVVVIDGPDLATLERLSALSEARLRIVALSENVGGSEARNTGIREARGTFIGMLDDDDEWLPEKITRQLFAFSELNAPASIVTSKHRLRRPGAEDRILPPRPPHAGENMSEYMFYQRDVRRPAYGPQTSTFFATKELFTAIPFKKGLKCHQDWQWFLQATTEPGVQHRMLEEPLCIVHEHISASSITRSTQWMDSLDWLESLRDTFTPRAYASFMVRQCLFRCAETKNRLKVFLGLLARCRSRGYLSLAMILIAVRWYIDSPARRSRLTQRKLALNGG